MPHDLKGKMEHCFCRPIGECMACCVCGYKIWDCVNAQKAFAVGILSRVWAGSNMPPAMIRKANKIRALMIKAGNWASA